MDLGLTIIISTVAVIAAGLALLIAMLMPKARTSVLALAALAVVLGFASWKGGSWNGELRSPAQGTGQAAPSARPTDRSRPIAFRSTVPASASTDTAGLVGRTITVSVTRDDPEQCGLALEAELEIEATKWVIDYLQHRGLADAVDLQIGNSDLRRLEIQRSAAEPAEDGAYAQQARVTFSNRFAQYIEARIRESLLKGRLLYAGAGSGGVLLILALAFGYLRMTAKSS